MISERWVRVLSSITPFGGTTTNEDENGFYSVPNPSRPRHLVQHRLSAMLPAISKVAVIGAGAAGLPAAKRLRDYGIEVVIFERNSVAGGGWLVIGFILF